MATTILAQFGLLTLYPIVAKNSQKKVIKEVKKTCGSPWNVV
jgi:hypothetical protein